MIKMNKFNENLSQEFESSNVDDLFYKMLQNYKDCELLSGYDVINFAELVLKKLDLGFLLDTLNVDIVDVKDMLNVNGDVPLAAYDGLLKTIHLDKNFVEAVLDGNVDFLSFVEVITHEASHCLAHKFLDLVESGQVQKNNENINVIRDLSYFTTDLIRSADDVKEVLSSAFSVEEKQNIKNSIIEVSKKLLENIYSDENFAPYCLENNNVTMSELFCDASEIIDLNILRIKKFRPFYDALENNNIITILRFVEKFTQLQREGFKSVLYTVDQNEMFARINSYKKCMKLIFDCINSKDCPVGLKEWLMNEQLPNLIKKQRLNQSDTEKALSRYQKIKEDCKKNKDKFKIENLGMQGFTSMWRFLLQLNDEQTNIDEFFKFLESGGDYTDEDQLISQAYAVYFDSFVRDFDKEWFVSKLKNKLVNYKGNQTIVPSIIANMDKLLSFGDKIDILNQLLEQEKYTLVGVILGTFKQEEMKNNENVFIPFTMGLAQKIIKNIKEMRTSEKFTPIQMILINDVLSLNAFSAFRQEMNELNSKFLGFHSLQKSDMALTMAMQKASSKEEIIKILDKEKRQSFIDYTGDTIERLYGKKYRDFVASNFLSDPVSGDEIGG